MSEEEDPDIAIIKARKMKALKEQAASIKRSRIKQQQQESTLRPKKTDRDIVSDYLYNRGEEVLNLAESQFPIQTKSIIDGIVELIRMGEIKQRISGGELLALFRSVGINVRINTSIKIEDHGKLVSFSEKLKQGTEEKTDDQ
jgi:DNA-binding TFAR19-related protein (PDSD5 family)